MTLRARAAVVALVAVVLLCLRSVALAQSPPPKGPAGATPPAAPTPAAAPTGGDAAPAEATDDVAAKKEKARSHFEKGIMLFEDEAWDAALAEFLKSREIYSTRAATKNAAICLRKLHRFDEALDMFENLLREFPNLPQEDRDIAEREVRTLKGLVGTIELRGGEPGATIVIDNRERGSLPAAAPIRVPAGSHVVRVYKEGFTAFEVRVDVAGGASTKVDVKLGALTQSGRLKVTEQTGKVLDVVVDNVVVGKTPWDGPLAPGDHTVLLRGEGTLGTQPVTAPVRVNQVTPLTLVAEELTAELRVEPTPAGAVVAIDGVDVGRGLWEGRLRAGRHRVEVASDGFLPFARDVTIASGKREKIAAQLQRDPNHPMWGTARSRIVVEADGAFALSPSFGGDLASDCTGGCSAGLPMGFKAALRPAYQLASGILLGIDAGFVMLSQTVSGRATSTHPTGLSPNLGTAGDALRLSGVMLGLSPGIHTGQSLPLTFRLGAGVLLGTMVDRRTGSFATNDRGAGKPSVPYDVDISETAAMTYFYVAPEARVGLKLGASFQLNAGLDVMVLIAMKQPTWKDLRPIDAKTDGQARFNKDGEQALAGRMVLAVAPGLGARYEF